MIFILVENQFVEVKIVSQNKEWYKKLGYDVYNKKIMVKAEDLTKGSNAKVDVKCDYCNNILSVCWRDYLKSKGNTYSCKKCRQTKTSQKTKEERIKYLYYGAKEFCDSKGYTILTDINEIDNSDSRIDYCCPIHGVNNAKIYSVLIGHGCPGCGYDDAADKSRHSVEDVIKVANKIGVKILNPEEYKEWNTKNLRCVCPECGAEYFATFGTLRNGKCGRCPECSNSESKGERKIRLFLEENNINYVQEKRFDDCVYKIKLPFDFYLPDQNTIIEYDGAQHFMPVHFDGKDGDHLLKITQRNDGIKNKYCESNNINMIRIPYWDFNNIEEILNKKLFTQ